MELLDCPVTEKEVGKAVKAMKNNKQPGKDGIRSEMISSACFYLCKPITKLFNFIWNTEQVSSSWSDGFICPIHKKGSRSDSGNYRGITLLSCLGKLFQTVVRNRLTQWADDILVDNQTGFKTGYCTMDNVFFLNTVIQKSCSEKKKTIRLLC